MLPVASAKPHFFWLALESDGGGLSKFATVGVETVGGFDSEYGVPNGDPPSTAPTLPRVHDALGGGDRVVTLSNFVMGKLGGGQHIDHSIKALVLAANDSEPLNLCLKQLTRGRILPPRRHPPFSVNQFSGQVHFWPWARR
jgi:hypothetical protein